MFQQVTLTSSTMQDASRQPTTATPAAFGFVLRAPARLVLSGRKTWHFKGRRSSLDGSADVDMGWALHSQEPGQRGTRPSLPPTSSYMTSSLGRAEAPQAVLLPICSRSPCLPSYLGLHYKEPLYGALKRFLSFPPVPASRVSLCKSRLLCATPNFFFPLVPPPPCFATFLFVCVFLLPPPLSTCTSEFPVLPF